MFAAKNLTLGQVNAFVKLVGGEDVVRRILGNRLAFKVEPITATFTVDTTNASMPSHWKDGGLMVEQHCGLGSVEVRFVDGEMYINDRKVCVYLTEENKGSGVSRRDVFFRPALPDAILDLLVRERHNRAVEIFLEGYKGRVLFFSGTTYREPLGGSKFSKPPVIRALNNEAMVFGGGDKFGWCIFPAHVSRIAENELALLPSESGT